MKGRRMMRQDIVTTGVPLLMGSIQPQLAVLRRRGLEDTETGFGACKVFTRAYRGSFGRVGAALSTVETAPSAGGFQDGELVRGNCNSGLAGTWVPVIGLDHSHLRGDILVNETKAC